MAAFTTQFVAASAGVLTMAKGSTVSFIVTWGSNISSFRFNRVWPAIVDAADEDIHQSVTFVSEGSQWDASNITSTPMAVTLRANGQSGAPIQARIQVFASQVDTF
ncbi:MAG TPA: hypothetical protein VKE95_13775 [Burkholderiales bacterium]|nr:hypothetical protein [Burkholderiales bacterium]